MSTPVIVAVVVAILFAVRKPILRVLAVLFVRRVVRGALSDVGKTALAKVDDAVTLVPERTYSWKGAGIEARYVEPLRGLGFVEAGGFAVDRMPGVHVQLLVHVVDRIQAHVYEHRQAGNWLELVSRYQDNSVFVVTNLPSQGVVRPPWNTTVNVEPDAGTGSMVQRLLKDRKREPLEPVSQNHAKIAFEIGYAQFMAWKKKTGITPEEVAHQIRRRLETPVA